jgi:acetoacetyl-CoA synthetase
MTIWRPTPEQLAGANLTHFMQGLARRRGVSVSDYSALHAWSVAEPEAFWSELASFAQVRGRFSPMPNRCRAPAFSRARD